MRHSFLNLISACCLVLVDSARSSAALSSRRVACIGRPLLAVTPRVPRTTTRMWAAANATDVAVRLVNAGARMGPIRRAVATCAAVPFVLSTGALVGVTIGAVATGQGTLVLSNLLAGGTRWTVDTLGGGPITPALASALARYAEKIIDIAVNLAASYCAWLVRSVQAAVIMVASASVATTTAAGGAAAALVGAVASVSVATVTAAGGAAATLVGAVASTSVATTTAAGGSAAALAGAVAGASMSTADAAGGAASAIFGAAVATCAAITSLLGTAAVETLGSVHQLMLWVVAGIGNSIKLLFGVVAAAHQRFIDQLGSATLSATNGPASTIVSSSSSTAHELRTTAAAAASDAAAAAADAVLAASSLGSMLTAVALAVVAQAAKMVATAVATVLMLLLYLTRAISRAAVTVPRISLELTSAFGAALASAIDGVMRRGPPHPPALHISPDMVQPSLVPPPPSEALLPSLLVDVVRGTALALAPLARGLGTVALVMAAAATVLLPAIFGVRALRWLAVRCSELPLLGPFADGIQRLYAWSMRGEGRDRRARMAALSPVFTRALPPPRTPPPHASPIGTGPAGAMLPDQRSWPTRSAQQLAGWPVATRESRLASSLPIAQPAVSVAPQTLRPASRIVGASFGRRRGPDVGTRRDSRDRLQPGPASSQLPARPVERPRSVSTPVRGTSLPARPASYLPAPPAPAAGSPPPPQGTAEGDEPLPPMPSGWSSYVDASGRTYYYHAISKTTTWTRPPPPKPLPPRHGLPRSVRQWSK